jgi:3-phenylpropionate/trans-cinnamate dioxygenase ferredoxin component
MTKHPIAPLAALTDGEAQRFEVHHHRLSVIRIGDQVYVIGDICTHQDISLSEGEVDSETCHIECWKHGSSFSLITGEPDVFPATRPVPVYRAWVEDGEVFVEIDDAEGATNV